MKTKAVLVSAPFGPLNLPSIGLSLLRDLARGRGYSADIHYIGMSFAEKVGDKFYNSISAGYPTNTALVGDYLFSAVYHSKKPHEIHRFMATYLQASERTDLRSAQAQRFGDQTFHKEFLASYRHAVDVIPCWVEETLEALTALQADVYGFTTMFQQNMASMIIAREIKQRLPESTIIFGGPNCENPMGVTMLENFPYIDMICSGEGERAFVSVLDHLESRGVLSLHPNVYTRQSQSANFVKQLNAEQINLEETTSPDYDDYFSQLALMPYANEIQSRVLLETSRGCWWGQKAHCTFCGLNGSSLNFRAKSAQKALEEIRSLRRKYPDAPISVVDNIIDYKYFKTLLPALSKEDIDVELFYETKANLTKQQLVSMRAAGITRIQPGIESLSSSVLDLMRKGVRAIQNICLLKWCSETGIKAEWNFLWGFPDEDPLEYANMTTFIPYLKHLTPPNGSSKLRLDRFSPLFEHCSDYPITEVSPYDAYFDVYELDRESLGSMAYYFTFEYLDQRRPEDYTSKLADQLADWKMDHATSYLVYSQIPNGVLIFDKRTTASLKIMHFGSLYKEVLEISEQPVYLSKIIKLYGEKDRREVEDAVSVLLNAGVLVLVDGLLFNVAINLVNFQMYPTEQLSALLTDLVKNNLNDSSDHITLSTYTAKSTSMVSI